MPVLKYPCNIIDEIRERLKVKDKSRIILRFHEEKYFDSESAIEPSALIEFIGFLNGFQQLEFLGGWTERGTTKLVNVYENLKEYLAGEREKAGFVNLYTIFFRRKEPPSGILAISPEILVFIPALQEPSEPIFLKFVGFSHSEKQRIKTLATQYRLGFYGEPDRPILYRESGFDIKDVKEFMVDVLRFCEDAVYAEI